MKDGLQIYLESNCILQFWVKKQIAKEKKVVTVINLNSLQSVKQRLKTKTFKITH